MKYQNVISLRPVQPDAAGKNFTSYLYSKKILARTGLRGMTFWGSNYHIKKKIDPEPSPHSEGGPPRRGEDQKILVLLIQKIKIAPLREGGSPRGGEI